MWELAFIMCNKPVQILLSTHKKLKRKQDPFMQPKYGTPKGANIGKFLGTGDCMSQEPSVRNFKNDQ